MDGGDVEYLGQENLLFVVFLFDDRSLDTSLAGLLSSEN